MLAPQQLQISGSAAQQLKDLLKKLVKPNMQMMF
jgi:hypothetical protein